jgi:hypothetical protein
MKANSTDTPVADKVGSLSVSYHVKTVVLNVVLRYGALRKALLVLPTVILFSRSA